VNSHHQIRSARHRESISRAPSIMRDGDCGPQSRESR